MTEARIGRGPCLTNNFSTQRQDVTGLELSDMGGGTTRIIAAIGTRGFATYVQYDLGQAMEQMAFTARRWVRVAARASRQSLAMLMGSCSVTRYRQPVYDRRAHECRQRHASISIGYDDWPQPAWTHRYRGRAEQCELHLRPRRSRSFGIATAVVAVPTDVSLAPGLPQMAAPAGLTWKVLKAARYRDCQNFAR